MLDCKKQLFDLSDEYSFLNCAYLSPQLKSVTAAGQHALVQKAMPYGILPEHFFRHHKGVKSAFADIINAAEPERIALLPSASYGISTAALNAPVQEGQEIIILQDQFPSNYYPWSRLAKEKGATIKMVGVAEGKDKGLRWNQAILEAINPKTAVVAIAHVHWAEGLLFDLAAIRKKSKEVGAWLIIDGTQSVGALDFDVQKIQPDALICASYKWLMAPYGTAVAYYGPAFDNGKPIEENWINRKDSQNFRNLVNYQEAYQPLAGRYSVGQQSNFVLMPMLETALQQIRAWEPKNIQAYCQHLNEPYLEELQTLGFSIAPKDQRPNHLLGLGFPKGIDPDQLQKELAKNKILVSIRGASIRVAPNVYNEAWDWERLMRVLRKAGV